MHSIAKHRQHLGFVLREEFDNWLKTLGAGDQQLPAHGFDAKSGFLGAMQERYSVHSLASSVMVRSYAIPPASRGRSSAAPLASGAGLTASSLGVARAATTLPGAALRT